MKPILPLEACWSPVLVVWLSIAGVAAPGATAASPFTAEQVLSKFAEMQSRATSFIAAYEFSRQDEVVGSEPWKGRHWESGEMRYDGRRLRERDRLWGEITRDTIRSRDKPYYKSRLFDGQWWYQYEQPFWRVEDIGDPRQGSGQLILHRKADQPIELPVALPGGALCLAWGILPHDDRRIDVRLRQAASVRVREKLEPAGWEPSACYVLEGNLPEAQQYAVWVDPAHGFQMAKGELRRTAGYRPSSIYTLQQGEYDYGFVEKVRFARYGDLCVPVEAVGGLDNVRRGYRCSMRFQLKVTRFLLNPDHDALRSFVPDDIRNGTAVYAEGRTNSNGTIIRDEWRDSQVVDKNGQAILSPSPRLIELRRQPTDAAGASPP